MYHFKRQLVLAETYVLMATSPFLNRTEGGRTSTAVIFTATAPELRKTTTTTTATATATAAATATIKGGRPKEQRSLNCNASQPEP